MHQPNVYTCDFSVATSIVSPYSEKEFLRPFDRISLPSKNSLYSRFRNKLIFAQLIPIILLIMSSTAKVYSAGYAIFPQQAITTIKTRIEKDPDARVFFAKVTYSASDALSRPPSALVSLDIEGNLASIDGRGLNDDMNALNALGLDFRLNGNVRSLDQARVYLLSWAKTYQPTGNPIDEELFYKFVAGYELVRSSLPSEALIVTDDFLRTLFVKEKAFTAAREFALSHSNWESRHLALVMAIAYTLDDSAMISYCLDRFRDQVSYNILRGGTIGSLFPEAVKYPQLSNRLNEHVPLGATFDLIQRDSMEYHVASLRGLIGAAWVAKNQSLDLLNMAGSNGQTLRDALNFTIPYATGKKTHDEFVGTLATFDKDHHRGGLFDARLAKVLLSMAAALDNRYREYTDPAVLPPFERVLYYSMSPLP
jgi:hypothetical protein